LKKKTLRKTDRNRPDADASSRFINRELSWLDFNDRVLQCAQNATFPLLERLKFLAITGSNLDEFFMVRVGGLQALRREGVTKCDPSGLTPAEQLAAIERRAGRMAIDQYRCLNELLRLLSDEGIRRLSGNELSDDQARHAERVFMSEIVSMLSPMAIGDGDAQPLLINRMPYCAVLLRGHEGLAGARKTAPKEKPYRLAVIPIGKTLGRFITLPSAGGYSFMLLEDLVCFFIDRFFPGETVLACAAFRIIRDADLAVHEDGAADLLAEMEAVIGARKRSDCVRLEIDAGAPGTLLDALLPILGPPAYGIYRLAGPLDLSAFMRLAEIADGERLRFKPWTPRVMPPLDTAESIFDVLRTRDILLYHPYDGFDPVVRFVREASRDDRVAAIKQILYRTSRNSPIVAALAEAARAGKYVSAVVELKARFDEERNIEWAQELEDAGVQVIYGIKNLKTHAKVCLVFRREDRGLVRYAHFGTGNYNEITARLYSDVSYLTAREELCSDASAFFNSISGNSQPLPYRLIEAAPLGLRERIISLIEAETERKRQGQPALIRAKMNSLTDPGIIEALYRASRAGVKIRLNVRGICCLKPGVKGLSETIEVCSIVGRYLEHARILHVMNGGKEKVFICTADWMQRNLDKRVELMAPVDDPECRNRLLHILDICFKCTEGAWVLEANGAWRPKPPAGAKGSFNCQAALYEENRAAEERAKRLKPTLFETHKPKRKKKAAKGISAS
jgi:polyphosphate kinase